MSALQKTVLVTGASGLVGTALCQALKTRGDVVRTLSRSRGDFQWDVETGRLDERALQGVDAVIHLAGEPVVQVWTSKTRERIMDSRVKGTQLLATAIAAQAKPPVFICASGVNYYGYDRPGFLDEGSCSGAGFLADVCREWEQAAHPAIVARARTVFLRTGIALSAEGGALAKMLPVFKCGLGGRVGSGTQRMSWISLHDLVKVYLFALDQETVLGVLNAVAPEPVTNTDFTKALGAVLGCPTVCPLPAALVRLLSGAMGKETVLANLAVLPTRLQELGFAWDEPELEQALKASIRRPWPVGVPPTGRPHSEK